MVFTYIEFMETTKTIVVRVERIVGTINYIAYPKNENARYACMLSKKEFLSQEDLAILERMGFNIEKQ